MRVQTLFCVLLVACSGPAAKERAVPPVGVPPVGVPQAEGGGAETVPPVDLAEARPSVPPEGSVAPPPLVLRELRTGIMGTELNIRALGSDATLVDRAMAAAVEELQRVETLMTDWRPSELTRLNDAHGTGPHAVPEELAAIISRGVELHGLTRGAFDITYASAGKLWDFKADPPRVPDAEAVRAALGGVDASRVRVDPRAFTVDLPQGSRIGLGGIAKGYGVDRAMAVLREHGVEHGIVDAGGDMKVLGKKFGEPWKIAIKHPRERERAMAVLRLTNGCVVTSGDYERFFELDGKRFHHIIDPRTGFPARGCLSASVVAPNAEFADALATALCVLGPADGLALIESLPRVEAILVGMDGEVHVSPGLKGTIR